MHRGVGVIATNPARTRFLVQRKDASYGPRPRGVSLFGGAVEPGESDEAALVRELFEELEDASARMLVDAPPRELGGFELGEHRFAFVLFEAVVDDATLDLLASRPVFEGERGELVVRSELADQDWVGGLAEVIAAYLQPLAR